MAESALSKTVQFGSRVGTSVHYSSNRDSDSEEPVKIHVCVKCGRTISKSLELTLHAGATVETYDACPHCLSRINVSSSLTENPREKKEDTKKTAQAHCSHFLGYLKTHAKESPYPDECLTCTAIMECLIGRLHEEQKGT